MKQLNQNVVELKNSFFTALAAATTQEQLEEIRILFLGRKGHLAQLMPLLKQLSEDDKRIAGPLLNELKTTLFNEFDKKEYELRLQAVQKELNLDRHFDITAYKPGQQFGSLHPLTYVQERIEDILISMGYTIADGPEIEHEFYNFEALNIPANHPARDMWDTFFLNVPGLVLRTHTSPVQIRQMIEHGAPLAIAAPGRCYRHEATDASHDIVFLQIEGLLVGKDISVGNILGTVKELLGALFNKKDLKIRVRPSYFPFVEPGLEIDASCPLCTDGCSLCKKTGWIEICGAGRVHPNVLRASNIDPEIYSGFAFGFGLTRLAMLHYAIDDIRHLHNPKIEFLSQF